VPGLIAAQGDLGKSYAILELGRRIAFTPGGSLTPLFGGEVNGQGAAVIITAEDALATIHRRLAKLDPEHYRYTEKGDRLTVLPLSDAGGPLAT
jgi:RecA-family ATPase